MSRDIEDLEGLRLALHYDKINVLGHSYGGLVAQGYALKYPQHVKQSVLANTFHSYIMWQENDDNSNHEIKTTIRSLGHADAYSRKARRSDPVHQEIYGRVPYAFFICL